MVNRMPQPALLGFAFHKTPHFIDLRRFHAPYFDRDRVRTTSFHHAFVYLLQHRVRPDLEHTCYIPYPTPIERHLHYLLFHRGETAGISIASQERPTTLLALLT